MSTFFSKGITYSVDKMFIFTDTHRNELKVIPFKTSDLFSHENKI